MKKVLSQKEIDDTIRAARSKSEGSAAAAVAEPVATLWDGRLAGQIGRKHMQALSRLHETFARNLSHSISAYLRIQFQTTLVYTLMHLGYLEYT